MGEVDSTIELINVAVPIIIEAVLKAQNVTNSIGVILIAAGIWGLRQSKNKRKEG